MTPDRLYAFMMVALALWAISGINMMTSYLKENYLMLGASLGMLITNAMIYTLFQKLKDQL